MGDVEKVIEENREKGVYQVLNQIYLHYLNYYMEDKDRTIFILHSIMFPPVELKEKAVAIYLSSTKIAFEKIKEIFVEGMDRKLLKRLSAEEHLNIYTQVIHTYYFDIAVLNRDLTIDEAEKAWNRYLDGVKKI